MKRKSMLLAVSMTCSMTAATGTVAFASDDAATEEAADDTEAAADDADAADTEEASDDTTEASDDDQKAADEVGALIDKIYVQERTDRLQSSKRSMGQTYRCSERTGNR